MPKGRGYPEGALPNTGPKAVRPPDERARTPVKQNKMAMSPTMTEKGGALRPDPVMATKPQSSGDGLGKMTEGMGGSRRVRQATGMPEIHRPGSS